MIVGQILGNIAGALIGIALLLLIPGDQGFWIAFLIGAGFSLVGGFLGRMAYSR